MKSTRERGQALVEMALLLPILLLITMGAIDFGRLYFAYTSIANAAREGAMCASLTVSCPGGAVAAANAEVGGALPGGITTTVAGGVGQRRAHVDGAPQVERAEREEDQDRQRERELDDRGPSLAARPIAPIRRPHWTTIDALALKGKVRRPRIAVV